MDILIICTGNTCRSPMAEGLFNHHFKLENIEGTRVKSAGIYTTKGLTPSENSIKIMNERDIDISEYRSTPITKELLQNSDLILTMTNYHKELLRDSVVDVAEKIYTLKEYAFKNTRDIEDPFGGDLDLYTKAFHEIEGCIKESVKKIKELGK